MSKQKRLGRGLEALLGRTGDKTAALPAAKPAVAPDPLPRAHRSGQEEPDDSKTEPDAEQSILPMPTDRAITAPTSPSRVSIEQIDRNPFQPRQDFDEEETRSLAESLADHGLLQPVVVRQSGERFELIAGERRLRAAQAAGWEDVPVRVVEADDRQRAELAIVENLQRKDLNALEKAACFQRYLETYGCTQEELAGRLKLDRSTIANLIRLLELPGEVQDAVRQGTITQGHARALLPLGDEREQIEFARRIRQEGLNVRQTETLVQQAIEEADNPELGVVGGDGRSSPRSRRPQSPHVAALEQEFRLALGTKVKITHSSRGRGKLVIHFTSHEEFERLQRMICQNDAYQPRSEAG